jgi:HK97 gp10 family phage protein
MANITLTAEGLDAAQAFTRRVADSIRPITERSIEACLQEMVDYAKSIVPVDTGFLRDSIDWAATGEGEWHFRAKAGYASYVELGTSKMQAQPFMQPAVEAILDEIEGKTDDAFADLVGAP